MAHQNDLHADMIYVTKVGSRGVRESQRIQLPICVVESMKWISGHDDTPWKNACLVAISSDSTYFRYID